MIVLEMQEEILNRDVSDIFDKYLEIFHTQLNLPTKTINTGMTWFRGRSHCDTFKVSFDDYDTNIEVPYFKKGIGAPPIEAAKGFRFNRANISYLYLTSDLNTCMAEIRLKENEICSISDFLCIRDSVYIDVIAMLNDKELNNLARILIQPITDNEHIYEITQFVSDIFKALGYAGILYPSTLVDTGNNMVCFYPDYFQFIMYSDRIYKGIADEQGSIFPVSQIDEFKRFPEYRKEMYSFGDTLEKEEAFEYIEDKFRYEDEQEYKKRKNLIDSLDGAQLSNALNEFVKYFSKTHLRKDAYQFRGTYYINTGSIETGIRDYISSLNLCKARWNSAYDSVIHDIFCREDIDNMLKTEELKQKINEVCNLYFQESDMKWIKLMERLKKYDL